MRPRMAFCIGITDGDQPSASPNLVFNIQLYPQNRMGKERIGRLEEIVTHIDTAAPPCISLHSMFWSARIKLPAIARKCWGSYPGEVISEDSRGAR